MTTRACALLLLALLAAPAAAQESRFQSDLRREGEDLQGELRRRIRR